MPISKEELYRRLSFVKYLHSVGKDQSSRPDPLCNISLLSLHDAIELFLQLACEHYEINATKATFMDYFDLLNPKIKLSQIESMRRFNKTRVSLKHHGTMASPSEIVFFVSAAEIFFVENTKAAFDIDFESLSLIDLVLYSTPKKYLKIAEEFMGKNQHDEALKNITAAFWLLIYEYENSKKEGYEKSPFFFGENMRLQTSSHLKIKDKSLATFIDKTTESIRTMQSAMKILSLGLDYRKFSKFDKLTPVFQKVTGGDPGFHIFNLRKEPSRKEDVAWCLEYVIECCVALQTFDYATSQQSA